MSEPLAFRGADIAAAVSRGLAASKDPAQAGDGSRSPVKYAQLSDDFRGGAWKRLDEDGDLPQASSKAWGMVAETIKAVSARHGGIIHAHRSIWHVLRELSQLVGESGDEASQAWINNAFSRARSLHTNFYEDEEAQPEVQAGLVLCEELSDRLYELFWPERPGGEIDPVTEE